MTAERFFITAEQLPFRESYPRNLLLAVKGKTDLTLPTRFTKDIYDGLQYALSTLEEVEQEVLRALYREGSMPTGISQEQAGQIERKALRKLRLPFRWNYIQYGIAGCLKRTAVNEYNKGYHFGYRAGYRNGVEDAQNGIVPVCGAEEILNLPIEELELSVHAYNCLHRVGYRRIRDIVGLRKEEICVIRRLGRKSAAEIARALQEYGIKYTEWSNYLF